MNKPDNLDLVNAWDDTIAHWEKLADLDPEELRKGCMCDSCPLCTLFVDNEPTCKGCPIAKYTGVPACKTTPWSAAAAALFFYRIMPHIDDQGEEEVKKAATAELNFLKHVRSQS